MSKATLGTRALPKSAESALRALGRDLEIARKRRRMSQRSLADRLLVNVETVQRLEAGDPAVGIGIAPTLPKKCVPGTPGREIEDRTERVFGCAFRSERIKMRFLERYAELALVRGDAEPVRGDRIAHVETQLGRHLPL